MNLSKRVKLLQNIMGNDLDSVLITHPADVFYYTGFFSEDPVFLVINKHSKPLLIVSELNSEAKIKAKADVSFFKEIKDLIKQLHGRVGYDESHLKTGQFLKLKRSKIKLRAAENIIKTPRMIKDSREIGFIKKSIRINKKILKRLNLYGKTEKVIAKNIEMGFLAEGSEKAFDTIIASGRNSGFVHHIPEKRVVKRSDSIIVDLGCKFNHYCCDMTRSFYPKKDKKGKEIFDSIKKIQEEIADFITPGIKFSQVQKFYEKKMKKYKLMHAFGHGIGLDVHERPFREDIIEKNMVITIEPGAYFSQRGCRIEDMFLVTNKGLKKLS